MLQPTTATLSNWPIAGDVADLVAIVQAQAVTVADQEALLHAYQGNLAAAQAVPAATGIGTATGTSLAVTGATGVILNGATVAGTGVPVGTTITGQQSGPTGGNGTYTTSVATTAASATLSFTPGGGPSPWPIPRDADTLNQIVQMQTAVIRVQTALIQHYQDLLNTSQTAAPPTGP